MLIVALVPFMLHFEYPCTPFLETLDPNLEDQVVRVMWSIYGAARYVGSVLREAPFGAAVTPSAPVSVWRAFTAAISGWRAVLRAILGWYPGILGYPHICGEESFMPLLATIIPMILAIIALFGPLMQKVEFDPAAWLEDTAERYKVDPDLLASVASKVFLSHKSVQNAREIRAVAESFVAKHKVQWSSKDQFTQIANLTLAVSVLSPVERAIMAYWGGEEVNTGMWLMDKLIKSHILPTGRKMPSA
jgi:hypothetical protein